MYLVRQAVDTSLAIVDADVHVVVVEPGSRRQVDVRQTRVAVVVRAVPQVGQVDRVVHDSVVDGLPQLVELGLVGRLPGLVDRLVDGRVVQRRVVARAGRLDRSAGRDVL